MRKEEETLDIEPPQVFICLCEENVNICIKHTLTLNWYAQNAGEIDKKLKSHYMTLHYITLNYIILHWITLHWITLRFI